MRPGVARWCHVAVAVAVAVVVCGRDKSDSGGTPAARPHPPPSPLHSRQLTRQLRAGACCWGVFFRFSVFHFFTPTTSTSAAALAGPAAAAGSLLSHTAAVVSAQRVAPADAPAGAARAGMVSLAALECVSLTRLLLSSFIGMAMAGTVTDGRGGEGGWHHGGMTWQTACTVLYCAVLHRNALHCAGSERRPDGFAGPDLSRAVLQSHTRALNSFSQSVQFVCSTYCRQPGLQPLVSLPPPSLEVPYLSF